MQTSKKMNWWILIAVGLGTFMTAIDSSVVNTISPIVTTSLNSDVATIEWVVTIYLLVISGLLLTFGRMGDLHGHKYTYLAGFAIFVVASGLCGAAGSAGMLIVFRGLQAIGAAMVMANGPAILTRNFPPEKRGMVLGLSGTMTYLGLMVGPTLGGWLTETFSWRWAFYINIPIGLLAILVSFINIPLDTPHERTEKFDPLGALIFLAGFSMLLLGLNRAHDWGWGSPLTLGVLAGSVVLLFFFIRWENRVQFPMLDLRLFTSRVFSAASASAVMNYICLYSVIFLMPYYLINARGFGPAQAGMILTAQPLMMAIVVPLSGTLSDRVGSRWLTTIGMLILATGLLLISFLGLQSPIWYILLSLGIAGVGIGLFVSPNNNALMGAAPANRQGIAAAVLASARTAGMGMGVGIAGAILTTALAQGEMSSSYITAISIGFKVAMGVALLGALTSSVRGKAQIDRKTGDTGFPVVGK